MMNGDSSGCANRISPPGTQRAMVIRKGLNSEIFIFPPCAGAKKKSPGISDVYAKVSLASLRPVAIPGLRHAVDITRVTRTQLLPLWSYCISSGFFCVKEGNSSALNTTHLLPERCVPGLEPPCPVTAAGGSATGTPSWKTPGRALPWMGASSAPWLQPSPANAPSGTEHIRWGKQKAACRISPYGSHVPLVPETLHPILMNFAVYTGQRLGPLYGNERGIHELGCLMNLLCHSLYQYIMI